MALTAAAAPALKAENPDDPHHTVIAISAAMRTWQERYLLVSGAETPWTWPANIHGVPAEAYPEDNFYCEDLESDALAAGLVRALAEAMTQFQVLPGREYLAPDGTIREFELPYLAQFLVHPSTGALEGLDGYGSVADLVFVRPPANYTIYTRELPADSPFAGITIENYETKFFELCTYLQLLDIAFIPYADFAGEVDNYHAVESVGGSAATDLDVQYEPGTEPTLQAIADQALASYRLGGSGLHSAVPGLFVRATTLVHEAPAYEVRIGSSSGYFVLDRSEGAWKERLAGHPVDLYVRRVDSSPGRMADSNYPVVPDTRFAHLTSVADGARFESPVFMAPSPEEISVANLPAQLPFHAFWNVEPYLVIRGNWKHAVDTVETTCACGPCEDHCAEPEVDFALRSVHVTISLGRDAEGPLGSLTLRSERPSALLSRPDALIRNVSGDVRSVVDFSSVHGSQPAMHPAPASGGMVAYPFDASVDPDALSLNRRALRQLVAPSWVASVVDLGESGYRLDFVRRAGLPQPDPATGRVDTSAAPVFRSFSFEHVGGDLHRFRVTRSEPDAPDRVALYEFDSAGNTWTQTTGTGPDVVRERVSRVEDGGGWTETRVVRGVDDRIVSERALRYERFPWNDREALLRSRRGELVERIDDPSGEHRVTRYQYFDDPGVDQSALGKVRLVEHPDGRWERREYDPDSGRVARIVRPFGDAAPDASDDQCRVRIEQHEEMADIDGDGAMETVETTIELALGLEVARTHRLRWSKPVVVDGFEVVRIRESRAVVPGAAWDATNNLVTETRFYASGADAGRVHSVIHADATMTRTRYERAQGRLVTMVDTGEPDASGSEIVRGRRTVTVTHPKGARQSLSTFDIETGLLLDRSETFDEDFDEHGRPMTVVHLDGTAEQFVYACCGLESHEDRAGTVETYGYDSLKRRTSVTRAGLTTISTYDAAGRVVETRQRSRAGDVRTISHTEYSPAGRIVATRDLLGRRTSVAEEIEPSGRLVRTTTRPDLSTWIEFVHRDGSVQAVGGTAAHPIAYEYSVVADTHDGLAFNAGVTTTIRLGAGGERSEWTRTYTDMLGRTYKAEVPSYSGTGSDVSLTFFNSRGQPVRQVSADGVTTLFAYDGEGRLRDTAIDADGNGAIDFAGIDRVTRVTAATVADPVRGILQRSTTSAWLTRDVDAPTVVAETEVNNATRTTWSRNWGRETETRLELPGGGEVRQNVRGADGVRSSAVTIDGFVVEQSVTNAAGESFGRQTFRYDAWGRREAVVDARNGETMTTYDAGDRVESLTIPAPDIGLPRQTTVFDYDDLDRVTSVTLPDGAMQFRSYHDTGETKREWGARTYPVEYEYDSQGRMLTMTTWQDFAGASGAATTRWHHHAARGTLERKTYTDGSHVDYTYSPGDRLATRLWARGVLTTYHHDPLTGDLSAIDYSDATPDVAYTYDRAGRLANRTDAAGTCAYHYDQDVATSEVHSAGLLAGLTLARGHDLGRLSSLVVQGPDGLLYQAGYDYRDAEARDTGRLSGVAFAGATVSYAYHPDSQLLRETVWSEGSTARVRATTLFDRMNRLVSRSTSDGAARVIRSFAYGYNAANQRERATLESDEFWSYGYDDLGQVTSGVKRTSGGAPIPGYETGYRFDDIGNRASATTNGRHAAYSANLLNQYEQRDVPRAIDVLGQAPDDAVVQVNGLSSVRTAKSGADDYFYTPYPEDSAGVRDITVRSTVPGAPDQVFDEQRQAWLPATPETFTHDADGNLTDDWRWHYVWDAENRLVAMETRSTAVDLGVPRQRLEFVYDAMGRRTAKRVHGWDASSGAWALERDTRYLYDGWNLLTEHAAAGSQLEASHVWGMDLSGSLQGAGGVGGLLFTARDTDLTVPVFDGNGNVTASLAWDSATPVAEFEYGPFGETLRATGPAAGHTAFRFSTKFTDAETELVYYGYRYYSPSTGRWLSRDPIEEGGGVNLYGMVGNDAINMIDLFGLKGNKALTDAERAIATIRPIIDSLESARSDCARYPSILARLKALELTVYEDAGLEPFFDKYADFVKLLKYQRDILGSTEYLVQARDLLGVEFEGQGSLEDVKNLNRIVSETVSAVELAGNGAEVLTRRDAFKFVSLSVSMASRYTISKVPVAGQFAKVWTSAVAGIGRGWKDAAYLKMPGQLDGVTLACGCDDEESAAEALKTAENSLPSGLFKRWLNTLGD